MARNATEHHTAVLFDLLVKDAASTQTENNEHDTVEGENFDQSNEERHKGDIDAPWGESNTKDKSSPAKTEVYSDAMYGQYIESRQKMLDELFDSKGTAEKAEQATIDGLIDHDFESRAPLLEHKAADPVKEGQARQDGAAYDFAAALLE